MEIYLKYYWLETYLLEEVNPRFLQRGYLEAEDFFCIIIWKANRAKSLIADRLLKKVEREKLNLGQAVRNLTEEIAQAKTPEARMRVLLENWGFHLPMASAILTVLYPEDFTVYDVRVAMMLEEDGKKNFTQIANITAFEKLWPRYEEFKSAVENSASVGLSLRDKDRNLWGKSFYEQLQQDVKNDFRGQAGAAGKAVTAGEEAE